MARFSVLPSLILLVLFLMLGSLPATLHAQSNSNPRVFEWETANPGSHSLWLRQNEKLRGRSDLCYLSYSRYDEETKTNYSISEIADFLVQPEEEEFKILIQHPASGLAARMGVRYSPLDRKNEWTIQIALAFEGNTKHIFDELNRTEAETVREKNWKMVHTSKEVRIGKKLYRFHFGCRNWKQ